MKIETYVHGKTELPKVGDLVLRVDLAGEHSTYIRALVVTKLDSDVAVEGPTMFWNSQGTVLGVNTPWTVKITEISWIIRFGE